MKKIVLFLVVFFMLPLMAHAASLTTGIDVDGIGTLGLGRTTYDLKLHTTLDYATITVNTIDSAHYTITVGDGGEAITGDKVPVVEGVNVITVLVTDGASTETWTINLTVDREMEIDSDNPQTGVFVSVVSLLILSSVGIPMYFYSKRKLMKRI